MLKDQFLKYFKDHIVKKSDRTLKQFAEELGWESSQSISNVLNGNAKFPKDKIKPLFENIITHRSHQMVFLKIVSEVEKEDFLVQSGIDKIVIKKVLDPNISKILSEFK